jgi:hypothetical protein
MKCCFYPDFLKLNHLDIVYQLNRFNKKIPRQAAAQSKSNQHHSFHNKNDQHRSGKF